MNVWSGYTIQKGAKLQFFLCDLNLIFIIVIFHQIFKQNKNSKKEVPRVEKFINSREKLQSEKVAYKCSEKVLKITVKFLLLESFFVKLQAVCSHFYQQKDSEDLVACVFAGNYANFLKPVTLKNTSGRGRIPMNNTFICIQHHQPTRTNFHHKLNQTNYGHSKRKVAKFTKVYNTRKCIWHKLVSQSKMYLKGGIVNWNWVHLGQMKKTNRNSLTWKKLIFISHTLQMS